MISAIRIIAYCMLAAGLFAASCMDVADNWVYNYVWWWCLPWSFLLLFTNGTDPDSMIAAAVFVALQQLLFCHMYGKADCHAFSVCALAECDGGTGILFPLCHMLLAVTLLAVVQLFRGNVTRQGKLRIPQPFIPYITVSFWIITAVRYFLDETHIYA